MVVVVVVFVVVVVVVVVVSRICQIFILLEVQGAGAWI